MGTDRLGRSFKVCPLLITPPPIGRVYGRRRGRPLKGKKAELFDTGLDPLSFDLPETPGTLDPISLFPDRPQSVWLEIGFGGGEHLAAQAAVNPGVGLIGCEPFIHGISSLLVHLDDGGCTNVRVFSQDARLLLRALRPASIDRAFLLFPDPWPKRRHAGRRFANSDNLNLIADVLRDSAEFRVATDHPILRDWMPAQIDAHPAFQRVAQWNERPESWPPTRYEAKAIAIGRPRTYLSYCRINR